MATAYTVYEGSLEAPFAAGPPARVTVLMPVTDELENITHDDLVDLGLWSVQTRGAVMLEDDPRPFGEVVEMFISRKPI